jgi:V/A-type H+-transporting ATPase subunit D
VRNLPPTKTNLLKLKEELAFATLGRELLDQKRAILVSELLALVEQATAFEKDVDATLAKAFAALEDATLAIGKLQVLSLSGTINIAADINIQSRKIMGVQLPVIKTSFTERSPYFGALGSDFRVDVAVSEFRDALGLMGRFAELKISIVRLAKEVRKTVRKVNALEKIAIPDLSQTISHIRERLEESDRDMFSLMKRVKNRLATTEEEVHTK